MLATILKSNIATQVSIAIMDAFVKMRHFILENNDIYKTLNNINNKLIDHDEKINYIFSKFDKKEQLFLPGETYDAYCKITDILNETQNEVIIVDSYVDKTILDFIKNVEANIILITSNKSRLSNLEIDKFNKQYNKLEVIKNETFHDRYFIIDRNHVFHLGTSLNYAGERVFSISKLEDSIIKINLINYILEVMKNSCIEG